MTSLLRCLGSGVLGLTIATALPASEKMTFAVPVEYHTLDNGLKVVLSPDHTAPIITVAVYYNIGFRIEPKDRTGFAHLFEHMMFQGSRNLGKMEFIRLVQKNGGVLNGSTRFDFTNYFEILPSNKLETALWAEADRMSGLAITEENLKNQKGVVENEVKANVINQPYGGFPWLDMPQVANTNWYNAHNFYGDFKDLDAASLADVKDFFSTYYAPNNASLVVVGDFSPTEAMAFIKKYFGKIKSSKLPPRPDLTEPVQESEKKVTHVDTLATRPALAFAYHMPPRTTPEYYAMGILDQILLQGEDSRLHQVLVKEKGYTGGISGGINADLGNMFDYNGPMLWTGSLIHDSTVPADTIMAAVGKVIAGVVDAPVDPQTLERARVKFRSAFYDELGGFFGFGRANLLACFALFDDKPAEINSIDRQIDAVTPELIQKTAREYLRSSNRTILIVEPGRRENGGATR